MTYVRPVIVTHTSGRSVRLSVAPNGSTWTSADVVALVAAAAIEPRVTPRAVWIRIGELPDVHAIAQARGVTVVRRKAP